MRDFPNETLSKNLLALSGFNLMESGEIGEAHTDPALEIVTSRNGLPIPAVRHGDRSRPLHSRFEPVREASRMAEQCHAGGFVIVLGFGGGYHVRELLRNNRIESILIVDFSYSTLRTVLSHIDVSDIFIDSRVRILIDPGAGDIHDYILERYIPAVMGDIRTLVLRSRTALLHAEFQTAMDSFRHAVEIVSEDYSVQARFGRRWISNTMANLARTGSGKLTIPPQRKVMIIAAGPSLDDQVGRIRRIRNSHYCIATDTALPWLRSRDILPDIVLSIDCQLITYHHFFVSLPPEIPVLFDLASPPTLTRQLKRPLFFSSGHPFSQYVQSRLQGFPHIDTSGGNVTHAAVSLANAIGARQIELFGADYSYPDGTAYASDTYLYSYFRAREDRFSSSESVMADFVYGRSDTVAHYQDESTVYTTPTLLGYRERLQQLAAGLPIRLRNNSPFGPQFPDDLPPESVEAPLFSLQAHHERWRSFLIEYAEGLTQLEIPRQDLTRFFTEQDRQQLELWYTLFPTASHFRHTLPDSLSGPELLLRTREWTIEEVQKTLDSNREYETVE
ncbi:hypothetical protein Spiaf_1431 [Spirochaeta africana DSM 8902]|uniref:6-hydroxymethylpterin diphosphokinase MptE-like domain-containing protein n=2 Tax=Spirochaeta TaxID=146 RepID=H9UJ01_SPIAZ|nr:hypothetical protein Spiaf_1431 [Spirochaeta africana DSM 8902]